MHSSSLITNVMVEPWKLDNLMLQTTLIKVKTSLFATVTIGYTSLIDLEVVTVSDINQTFLAFAAIQFMDEHS